MSPWNASQVYGGLGTAGLGMGLGAPGPKPLPRFVQKVLEDQPVSFFIMDDLNAALVKDSMGVNDATGPAAGVTYRVGGPLADGGFAMLFDGAVGSFLATGASPVWDPSNRNPFTVEALLKPTVVNSTTQRIICREPVGNHGVIVFVAADNTWRGLRGDSAAGIDQPLGPASQPPAPLTWAHVAIVYDGTLFTVWVNGLPGTPISSTRNVDVSTAAINIGRSVNGGNGGVAVALAAVYKYAVVGNRFVERTRLFRRSLLFPDMPAIAAPYIAKVYTNGLTFKKTLGGARALVKDKPGLKSTIHSGQHPVVLEVVAKQPFPNFIQDPGFEAANVKADTLLSYGTTAEWTLMTTPPADVHSGRRAVKCTRTNVGPSNWNAATTPRFNVVPGSTLTGSMWQKQNAGTKQTHAKINYYDKAGAAISSQFSSGTVDGVLPWTYKTMGGIVPSAAVTAEVQLMAGWWDAVTGTDTQSWFDDVRVVQGAALDDPVESGDIIQLTEQGDASGTVVYTGTVEEIPDETSEGDEIHQLVTSPLVTELGDTYFNAQYDTLTDVAQMVRDAVNATDHLRVQPETCGDTGVLAVADFTESNCLEVLNTAKRIAGRDFWWYVDPTGLVWFQSMTLTNPAKLTLSRGHDYATWKRNRSIVYLKNRIKAIGGFPAGVAAAITSQYSNVVSQRKYRTRALDPPLIYPGITDQDTLDKIVATVGDALDRERFTYTVELPEYEQRLSLGVPGGLTVRLLDHAADQVTQPMPGSGSYLGPFLVQDIETDGVKQSLILSDAAVTSYDDLKYEIDRIVQRLGVQAISPSQKISGTLGSLTAGNPGSQLTDIHGLLGEAVLTPVIDCFLDTGPQTCNTLAKKYLTFLGDNRLPYIPGGATGINWYLVIFQCQARQTVNVSGTIAYVGVDSEQTRSLSASLILSDFASNSSFLTGDTKIQVVGFTADDLLQIYAQVNNASDTISVSEAHLVVLRIGAS